MNKGEMLVLIKFRRMGPGLPRGLAGNLLPRPWLSLDRPEGRLKGEVVLVPGLLRPSRAAAQPPF